jgi:hypothetical protein
MSSWMVPHPCSCCVHVAANLLLSQQLAPRCLQYLHATWTCESEPQVAGGLLNPRPRLSWVNPLQQYHSQRAHSQAQGSLRKGSNTHTLLTGFYSVSDLRRGCSECIERDMPVPMLYIHFMCHACRVRRGSGGRMQDTIYCLLGSSQLMRWSTIRVDVPQLHLAA